MQHILIYRFHGIAKGILAEGFCDTAAMLSGGFAPIRIRSNGLQAETVSSGEDALDKCTHHTYDLILLDINMRGIDGFGVVQRLRSRGIQTPIIIVSGRQEDYDTLYGLDIGADDYVTKPFDAKEVIAPVKAVLRRCQTHSGQIDEEVIKFENIEISLQKYELKLKGKSVDIPPKELELLYFLSSNYNRVFTRDQLLDKVWGFDYLGDSRTVDVHVKRLREKLEGVSDKWFLQTVWGVGYKFKIEG